MAQRRVNNPRNIKKRTVFSSDKPKSTYIRVKGLFQKDMASRKSIRHRRIPKHFRLKGLKGKKENIFYFDKKSGHPFISQSKDGSIIYGHRVTHSPSRSTGGLVKAKYHRFPSQTKPGDKRPSFFDGTLERIDNSPKEGKTTGRLHKKAWVVSLSNKKALRKVEKARMQKARKKAR